MLKPLTSPRQPDHDEDVIVQYRREAEPNSNRTHEHWGLWVGSAHRADYDDERSASKAALGLSTQLARPAWVMGRHGHADQQIKPE
jgi:hypothetical protein